jgi:hypothetical protein
LQQRYEKPIYGTPPMPSLNLNSGWSWVRYENGRVVDPYRLLNPMFEDADLNTRVAQAESADDQRDGFIANGGAATVAYAELQRPELSRTERMRYETQLLRYCELDSLAMVMIYEGLRQWLHR